MMLNEFVASLIIQQLSFLFLRMNNYFDIEINDCPLKDLFCLPTLTHAAKVRPLVLIKSTHKWAPT